MNELFSQHYTWDGKARTSDDRTKNAIDGVIAETKRSGQEIVASVSDMKGTLSEDMQLVGNEVAYMRQSLEAGVSVMIEQQAALLAATLSPQETRAKEHSRRALDLMSRLLLPEARNEAEQCLADDPYDWNGYQILGMLDEESADIISAAENYEKAIRYSQGKSEIDARMALLNRARVAEELGDSEGAVHFSTQAYDLDGSADTLYLSATYMATLTPSSDKDAIIVERLERAVNEKIGLAGWAMLEPRLAKRPEVRDLALGNVRDMLHHNMSNQVNEFDRLLAEAKSIAQEFNDREVSTFTDKLEATLFEWQECVAKNTIDTLRSVQKDAPHKIKTFGAFLREHSQKFKNNTNEIKSLESNVELLKESLEEKQRLMKKLIFGIFILPILIALVWQYSESEKVKKQIYEAEKRLITLRSESHGGDDEAKRLDDLATKIYELAARTQG